MTPKDPAPATPAHLWEWQPIQALYWCPACRAYAESSDASHLPPAPAPAGETAPPVQPAAQPEGEHMAELEWKDISSEKARTYTFPGGETLRIDGPKRIAVSDSGGHRIETVDGRSLYVAPKWLWFEFLAPFSF